LGVFSPGGDTAWRLRNGTVNGTVNNVGSASFFATGGGFNNQYFLPAGTDTFVRSTVNGTHRLRFTGVDRTKARGTQTVSTIATIPANSSYSLRGAGGNDTLTGGAGNDTLTGGAGADTLNGGNGNDNLIGSGGADTLIGGAGNDTLSGGNGTDRFVFNAPNEGVDTITDFGNGADAIVVSNAGFGGGLTTVGGTLSPTLFGAAAGGAVRFVYSGGVLQFDTDPTAVVSLVTIATLTGAPTLTAANILVVA
jgi:Ca2+-binding RTX toxin-like protein